MTRVFLEDEMIRVPAWVIDLESFRRWTDDEAFPETGQISFLMGEVWVDMSKEQLFSHNQVKAEITVVLAGLVKSKRLGRYFSDGAFFSHVEADISNQPDGIYVSKDSIQERSVRIAEGRTEGHVELKGSPDMVLEVVSRSSVEKDTEVLKRGYYTAGVREYWLVDAREETIRFDIFKGGKTGYSATRKKAGWIASEVFQCQFKLNRQQGEDGYPEFVMEMRA